METPFKNAVEFSASTHTALEAATQLGCSVSQIAKSIVFKGSISEDPVLVIASGSNKVDTNKVTLLIGEPVEKANAEFCKEKTGFVIGGIPPFGHLIKIKTLFDEDLLKYDVVWASAGTSNSVFKATPQDILKEALAICGDVVVR